MDVEKLKLKDQVLWHIGVLLVTMQTTERVINTALTLALPEGGVNTIDSLSKAEATYRKATLGRLIEVVKSRVKISEDFDEVLTAFIVDRNTLVHDLDRMGGFRPDKQASMEAMRQFLDNLHRDTEAVTLAFTSLLAEWAHQNGLASEYEFRIRKLLGEFDGIADQIFLSK